MMENANLDIFGTVMMLTGQSKIMLKLNYIGPDMTFQ